VASAPVKLLLDTHVWLWYLLGDFKLSVNLQSVIAATSTELWLSPISIWETVVLAEKKRISLIPNADLWIKMALVNLPIYEATLNHDIAILSRQIQLPHQDPADRFIAATACHYGLVLATIDQQLIGHPWLKTLS